MIAVNNNPIDLNAKGDKVVDHYKLCLKLLKELPQKVTLKYSPNRLGEENPNDKDSRPTQPTGFDIPMSTNLSIDGANSKVTYFEDIIETPKGKSFKPGYYTFSGDKQFDTNRDADLLYYLLFVSPYCESIPLFSKELKENLSKKQNGYRKTPWYKISDKAQTAESLVKQEILINKANMIIMDAELGIKDEELIPVAFAYNIMNANDLEPDEIRLALKGRILAQVNNKYDLKAIQEFIDSYKLTDKLIMLGKINFAEKAGIIKLDSESKKRHWKMLDENGELTIRVCEAPLGQNPHNIFQIFIQSEGEEETLALFEKHIQDKNN